MADEHGSNGKENPLTSDLASGAVKINAQDGANVTINIKVISFDLKRLRELFVELKLDGMLNATFALILAGIFQ